MGLPAAQLAFLVKNCEDPDVARFVLANLQDPPNERECASMLDPIRAEARRKLAQTSSLNQLPWPQLQPVRGFPAKGKGPSAAEQGSEQKTKILQRQQDGLLKLQKDLLQQQFQNLIKQQQKQQQETATTWRYLMGIENETLIRKMSDPNPLVCMLATQVAGRKRLPVEKECIGLLNSINPNIRQAARQTLIRLGRGVDFGPEPTAGPPQIASSVRSWASWASIQTEEPIEEMKRQPPPVIAKQIPAKPEDPVIELEEPLVGRRTTAHAPARVVPMARLPESTAPLEVEWTEPVRKVELTPQQEGSPGEASISESPPSFAPADAALLWAGVVFGVAIIAIVIRVVVRRRRAVAPPTTPVLSGVPSIDEAKDRAWWLDQASPFEKTPPQPPATKLPWWVDQPSPF